MLQAIRSEVTGWQTLPRGLDVVVRANPPAAEADHARLAAELDRLLARCLAKVRP